ncbi:MAG: T9SS type A sorting domain-containing protein [Saprospiraceae bacterium]|nr:T9SS type A sorting domain-containing protein [Saprospiraceae bacterium]
MRLKFYSLLAMLSLNAVAVFGQQPDNSEWCGTKGITPWFDFYRLNREALAAERGGVDTAWLYVPVTVQITGTDSGTGYYPFEQAIQSICQMNEHFAPTRIRYYLQPGDPVRYLNSTYWHNHQWEGGADLIETNRIPNRLNTFIVADPAGNCGYSWMDAIVMSKSCSGYGNRTWAHEAGHHLSLPHPFLGWEGFTWDYSQPAPLAINTGWDDHEVEKADSSNSYVSGDYFRDTRADYLNYRWSCNSNSESTLLQHDPGGAPFRSDGTLIMGYSSDECGAVFTQEQVVAMRTNLQNSGPGGHAEYLQVTEPGAEIDDDAVVQLAMPIDSQAVQYNDITLHWDPVPNATFYTVEIFLFANLQPRLFYQTVYNATSLNITKGIPNNRTLYWRVRVASEWDLCQPANNQSVGIFKTKNFSATNDLESVVLAEVSPNPVAAGYPAKLLLTADESMEAAITITDASGRQCQRQTVKLSYGENILEIPTEALQAGLYTLSIQNEKGTILKRLAVTN